MAERADFIEDVRTGVWAKDSDAKKVLRALRHRTRPASPEMPAKSGGDR